MMKKYYIGFRLRIISLMLIQAFLSLDVSCVGQGLFFAISDTSTLAPQVAIQAESLVRVFEEQLSNSVTALSEQPSGDKGPKKVGSWRKKIGGFILLANILLATWLPFNPLPAFSSTNLEAETVKVQRIEAQTVKRSTHPYGEKVPKHDDSAEPIRHDSVEPEVREHLNRLVEILSTEYPSLSQEIEFLLRYVDISIDNEWGLQNDSLGGTSIGLQHFLLPEIFGRPSIVYSPAMIEAMILRLFDEFPRIKYELKQEPGMTEKLELAVLLFTLLHEIKHANQPDILIRSNRSSQAWAAFKHELNELFERGHDEVEGEHLELFEYIMTEMKIPRDIIDILLTIQDPHGQVKRYKAEREIIHPGVPGELQKAFELGLRREGEYKLWEIKMRLFNVVIIIPTVLISIILAAYYSILGVLKLSGYSGRRRGGGNRYLSFLGIISLGTVMSEFIPGVVSSAQAAVGIVSQPDETGVGLSALAGGISLAVAGAVVIRQAMQRGPLSSGAESLLFTDASRSGKESTPREFDRNIRNASTGVGLQKFEDGLADPRISREEMLTLRDYIIPLLVSHNALAKVTARGNAGDMVLVFETPGSVIKPLNDILGYEGNTDLMRFRNEELQRIMQEEMGGHSKFLYSNYKGAVYLLTGVSEEGEDLQAKIKNIKEKLENAIVEKLAQDSKYRNSMEDRGIHLKINSATGKKYFEGNDIVSCGVNFGIAAITEDLIVQQGREGARLVADIMARKAIVLDPAAFERGEYKKFIFQAKEARISLQELTTNGIELFEEIERLDDVKPRYALSVSAGKILKAGISWEELNSEQKSIFGESKTVFEAAKEYWGMLRIQDYIKQWNIDPTEAQEWSNDISELIRKLRENDYFDDEELKNLLLSALDYLSQDPKHPGRTSSYVFHSQAAQMKNPVYITTDVQGMNVLNHREFEIEIQRIEEALGQEDWGTVYEIWTRAADPVTQAKNTAVETAISVIKTNGQSGLEIVTDTSGGDEFVVVFDQEVEIETLGSWIEEIQREVKEKSGLDIRIAASAGIKKIREESAPRELRRGDRVRGRVPANYLAHAKILIELESGIHKAKEDEVKGAYHSVYVQDHAGHWNSYAHNDGGTSQLENDAFIKPRAGKELRPVVLLEQAI